MGAFRLSMFACIRCYLPYASVNWIRFEGSLCANSLSVPLAGAPLVTAPDYARTIEVVKEHFFNDSAGSEEVLGFLFQVRWGACPR